MKPGRGGMAGLADAARDTAKQTLVKYKPWDGTFLQWAAEHRNFRGKPFGLAGHEYLREPYATLFGGYRHVVMEKAAQMGASELAMTWALYFCDAFPRTKTIFFFPTDEKVKDFSSDRLAPIIDDSPRLNSICRGTQNTGLKHVGLSSIYLRGMYAKEGTKSVNADCLIFDELDESKRANKRQALQRIKHSEFGYIFELSTPTLPGFGIDEQWVTTDQRYWHVRCRCPEGCVLEDQFPECVILRDGEWILRCPACGQEGLDPCDPATVGEYTGWVPLFPERARRGYHLTQLFSTVLDREETMEWWESGKDRDEFYNSVLGKPFAGDRMPLPMEVLNRCRSEGYDLDPRRANMNDRIFMGVDQGNTLHVTIWKEEAQKRKRLMWAQRLGGRDPFGDLADLIRRVKPTQFVIDDQPNTVPARQIARQFRGGWTCQYQESAKDEMRWDRDRRLVAAHRTDTLDLMAQEWQGQNLLVPGGVPPPEEVATMFKHLAGLAKKQEANPLTGVEEIVYITNGADHYAHSANYAHIASQAPGGRCSFDLL